MSTPPNQSQDPDFGPGGYLPPKAAQRARKIVLREQMGLQWTIAAVVAGAVILAVVIPLVIAVSGPPEAPFVEVGPLERVDPRGDALLGVEGTEVLVVRGGGVLMAFAEPPDGARYCSASRRIEDADGNVWTLVGRRVGGDAPSLQVAGAVAYEGRLYLDVTTTTTPEPTSSTTTPRCDPE